MQNESAIKQLVKERYGTIAEQSLTQNKTSCCGATGCCNDELSIMADDYSQMEGYVAEADLGLGCGLPTQFAQIDEGDTVIDLGSGAGNDLFIARSIVGEKGKLIGIDITEQMIERARENANKMGYNNVEFRLGDIDSMPVSSSIADVVVSNCVLNLVPNKHKVFSEIFRVLKPGAHFSISDIVLTQSLPEKWKTVAELYAGCVAGAIPKEQYLDIIRESGFTEIEIQKERAIELPDEVLQQYLNEDEVRKYKDSSARAISITVFAKKPSKDARNCCEPGSGCC